MNTLADAWNWYMATKANLSRIRRLAEKHWDDLLSAHPPIRHDEHFKTLDADGIVADSEIEQVKKQRSKLSLNKRKAVENELREAVAWILPTSEQEASPVPLPKLDNIGLKQLQEA